MQVTVMFRNNWFGGDGWTYYPVTVEIGENCPICGSKRGEPRLTQMCEDGEWYSVHQWDNQCGHIDAYPDVLVEAGHVSASASEYRQRQKATA